MSPEEGVRTFEMALAAEPLRRLVVSTRGIFSARLSYRLRVSLERLANGDHVGTEPATIPGPHSRAPTSPP